MTCLESLRVSGEGRTFSDLPADRQIEDKARRGKRNRGLRTYTFPLSRRRLDSAIYSRGVWGCSDMPLVK